VYAVNPRHKRDGTPVRRISWLVYKGFYYIYATNNLELFPIFKNIFSGLSKIFFRDGVVRAGCTRLIRVTSGTVRLYAD